MRKTVWLLIIGLYVSLLAGCGGGAWDFIPNPVEGNDPAIRITKVIWIEDPFGRIIEIKAAGQVYNVRPSDYKVSVWIRVWVGYYGWWPKPTWDRPYTSIGSDGKWKTADLTAGGRDEDADAVKAYLVKRESAWRPGQNQPPPGDIVAEDIVYKPQQAGVDPRGVLHEFKTSEDLDASEAVLPSDE